MAGMIWSLLIYVEELEVTLFNKEGFQGESVTIKSGRIDLGKFRKKVKSMKVVSAAS